MNQPQDHDSDEFVGRMIDAHGGAALWNSLRAVEAEISVRGLLFTAKQRPVLDRVRVTAAADEPRFTFHDFPYPGLNAELVGADEVRITGPAGEIVSRRSNPRDAFGGLRRIFSWDELDFTYFGGYATWNYLTAPFLFLRKGFRFAIFEDRHRSPGAWTQLRVTFPPDIPTHCREQTFFFDESLLLRRLDYTAEVVGGWAHAAHVCDDYRNFDGLLVPTRRRVRPVLAGRVLPGPTLVAIDVHDVRLVREKR